MIDNSTSTSITANYHNQDTSTRRFTAFNNPQRRSHSRSLFLATQISVTNHLPQPPLTRTLQQQHQSQRHHPQCHRLQQRQQINMPLSSSDPTAPSLAPPSPNRITKPRFLRHRHHSGSRSQEVGKKETEAGKIINPATSTPHQHVEAASASSTYPAMSYVTQSFTDTSADSTTSSILPRQRQQVPAPSIKYS